MIGITIYMIEPSNFMMEASNFMMEASSCPFLKKLDTFWG
jgi:hypothetical protein